jgi:adiponectin receptor
MDLYDAIYPLPFVSSLLHIKPSFAVMVAKIPNYIETIHKNGRLSPKKAAYCLCRASDLPLWHFRHRYLETGYRKSPSTLYQAARSLFQWHNESINIWLHYISPVLLIFFASYLTDGFDNIINQGTIIDQVTFFSSFFVANVSSLLISAACHQFYYVNQQIHELCWFFDFSGILLGMVIGGVTFMYFVFYCQPYHIVVATVVLTIGFVYSYISCWNSYHQRMRKRVLVPNDRFPEFASFLSSYAVFASIGPVFVALWFRREYIYEPSYRWIIIQTFLSPVISTIGILIFAKGGVPEIFCKPLGLRDDFFDMVGHSHQLWHLFAAAAMFNWIHILVDHYALRTRTGECLLYN